MGNTSSAPSGTMYESLSPSTEQVVEYISRQVKTKHPELELDYIKTIAHYVVDTKTLGSHRNYHTYYHEKFLIETVKQCKLRQNMRFLVNMILFRIRLKHVITNFRIRYYRPPNEEDPEDKGGKGYQNALIRTKESFAETTSS